MYHQRAMIERPAAGHGDVVTFARRRAREDWLDRGALAASGLCLLHCLLLPVVLALLPALETAAGTRPWFHQLLFALIVPTSGLALVLGWLRRRIRTAFLMGASGVGLLLTGMLAGEGSGETIATVCGSLLLAGAHVINWRSRRCADGCGMMERFHEAR